ncbi:U3 small nucleolar RNA-associated protein 6-domain-containing protein [Mycena maculata]|uniref:U3 small nucleolar RNA-associated protein 6-domain-containing protein n=1 Tax=Mycena maculata TaxID=230809 RepID=A0AAD7NC86_9AGAR|nr:U3 small nucleolar RNA-associated protein 6-domain-containing protein [Mycena maculata]
MERVQFQQEQMLAELKDLVAKDLFTQAETKAVMKKRTQFETALVRRVAKKADFLRYVEYEMGLEQLRRKRVARLEIPPGPATISDYALVRRQFHIFERALKKFRSDLSLWLAYLDLVKREHAHTLYSRVVARAIQMHPTEPSLYVLAAQHELSQGSQSAGRAMLQRGVRMCGDGVDIWREWVRMEMGFVEKLRRRWGVLGLEEEHVEDETAELLAVKDGEEARAAIMRGAIVKSVIASAAKALGTTELFTALIALIDSFPFSDGEGLAEELLEQVYGLLRHTRPRDPRAARILAERFLPKNLSDTDSGCVDGVQKANEEMLALCGEGGEDMVRAYVEFAGVVVDGLMDESLKLYLVSSVRRFIGQHGGLDVLQCRAV